MKKIALAIAVLFIILTTSCTNTAPPAIKLPIQLVEPSTDPLDDPELFLAVHQDLEEYCRLKKVEYDSPWCVDQIRQGKEVYHKDARSVWYTNPSWEAEQKWKRVGERLGRCLEWASWHQWDEWGLGDPLFWGW